jgi:uncharacterized membrane protein
MRWYGGFGRWICLVAVAGLLLFPGGLWGQDSASGFKDFVDSVGKSLYFLAWPTATYEGVDLVGIAPNGDAVDITVHLYGKSAFSDGPLWVDTVVEIRNGQITDLRWGRNNAILAAPGSTIKAMAEALAQVNADYQRDHPSPQAVAPQAVRPQAVMPQAAVAGVPYHFTNQCSRAVNLAIRYTDASGQWQTTGWWRFTPSESANLELNGGSLRSNSRTWFFYAETTDGALTWGGDQATLLNDRTLSMKQMTAQDGNNDWSVQCP